MDDALQAVPSVSEQPPLDAFDGQRFQLTLHRVDAEGLILTLGLKTPQGAIQHHHVMISADELRGIAVMLADTLDELDSSTSLSTAAVSDGDA